MTRDDVGRLLERLRAPILPPKLQSLSTRYRFAQDDGESWDLLLNRGALAVEAPGGSPDCKIECSPDECSAILSGRHNLLTAFMRGDVRLRGTVQAAKNLYTYLRYAQVQEAKG